eukprot:GFUD01022258.1.p1 GENE.GFUD01022258.1~~GFUD01022258.1.p1  ORF type:complete len:764 (+),score=170.77 GFUD01022258.1:69-2360(+)
MSKRSIANFSRLFICISFLLCKIRSYEFSIEDEENQELIHNPNPLLESDSLNYAELVSSAHGRHLLLVSLLEKVQSPYWVPRCSGYLQLFLPLTLATPDQPPLVTTGQMLKNITNHNGTSLDRSQVIAMLNGIENFQIWPETRFSRFDKYHMAVMHRLSTLFVNQSSFDNMYSIMVVFKEFLSDEMFVDSVYQVIQKRTDVGFIIPSVVSVQPEDFFPGALIDKGVEESSTTSGQSGREKRQAGTSWARGRPVEVAWHQDEYRTMPEWEPEGRLWYFNEDPLVNANHFHWHQVLSSEAEFGSRLHSTRMDRRGEMFYFMHKQLLCRINNERLSVGLNLTNSFGPDRWSQPVYPGYDPKLGRGSVQRFAPRPAGATLLPLWQREMRKDLASVRQAIEEGVLVLGRKQTRMEYRNGRDMGISALGNIVESYVPSYVNSRYGDLHNLGHTCIGNLHMGSGEGVMNSPKVGMRDPLFSQWHKFTDDLFQEYKRKLGFYQDSDLDFPGVSVTNLTLQSVTPESPNSLTTYLDHRAQVQLNSLDFTSVGSSSVLVKYSRLNHVPFTYTFTVHSSLPPTRGMVRIFLIPADVHLSSDDVDVTQLAIEMDRFQVSLTRGLNSISRRSADSSFVSKRRDTLYELQTKLMWGLVTEDQFNWAGCGWPKEMTLPRGSESGKPFRVFLVLSSLLESDAAHSADWRELEQTSWSWCGVRKDRGGMPDSRPMGFPLDRPPPGGTWRSLMYREDGSPRSNLAYTNVNITFLPDPWGLA